MEVPRLVLFTLVVMMATFAQTTSYDYSPCYSDVYVYGTVIACENVSAVEVLAAFHRNQNNTNIYGLQMSEMRDDMTDDIMNEILAASSSVKMLSLLNIPKLTRIPEAVRQLPDVEWLILMGFDEMKSLARGSVAFSDQIPFLIGIYFNAKLEVIEPGAFQGDFNSTLIDLHGNNLKTFDEAVFKPLLSDSTAQISVNYNPIVCDSCSWAWLIRDNRQYLSRITATCTDSNGGVIDINNIDPTLFTNC